MTRDFNRRNTTLGLAVSYSQDKVTPAGGFYDPLTPVGTEPQNQGEGRLARFEGRSKRVFDAVVSMTPVLDRRAVLAEIRRLIHGAGVNLSYWFYNDSWGVNSHEIDLGLHVDFGSTGSVQPHVRWYYQTSADFYRTFLVEGQPLPQYASADSRLASFHAITSGLTYGVPINPQSKLKFTLEYYLQRGDVSPPEGYERRLAFELFPKLDGVMLRAGYVHEF